MGEALRCGAAAVRLHLQHRERHCGASYSQPVLSSGGIQRGPAGDAEGRLSTNTPKSPLSALLFHLSRFSVFLNRPRTLLLCVQSIVEYCSKPLMTKRCMTGCMHLILCLQELSGTKISNPLSDKSTCVTLETQRASCHLPLRSKLSRRRAGQMRM